MFNFEYQNIPYAIPKHIYPDDILSREGWNARKIRQRVSLKIPVSNVILIFYTGRFGCYREERCKQVIRDLQRRHLKDELTDIQYNFLIGGNGVVYEGRGWTTVSPVPKKYTPLTAQSFTIAYIGDYSDQHLPGPLVTSTFRIINLAIKKNIITKNYDLMTNRDDI